MIDFGCDVPFAVTVFIRVWDDFGYAERVRVEGGLRNEAVWEWDAEETSNAGCYPEKE